ncbi:unnamed protein product [Mesocestoides corti]|uniref:Uncharacterized protein n=1 Tax=Mesocestoides corti TaxID=53468 RepID=A0A3P6GY13_MESCO|nr:unnamed protein product [Mesocestoides corti]
MVYVDCFFTILLCSVFVWILSKRFEYLWSHKSFSSVSTLVVAFCVNIWCFMAFGGLALVASFL